MQADRLTVGSEEITFRVTSKESDGELTAFDVRIPAGGGPPMLHRHGPFEIYRVERGELAFYLEDEGGTVRRTIGEPGSVVAIPGGREHTVRNEGEAEARAFVVFTPGAQMERFARAAGELGARGALQVDDVLALAQENGVEITRPVGDHSLVGARGER